MAESDACVNTRWANSKHPERLYIKKGLISLSIYRQGCIRAVQRPIPPCHTCVFVCVCLGCISGKAIFEWAPGACCGV